ncbi:MAG TPA: nitroreductase family protein [Steroidobacter sp.]|nr:nitroreductase family protein [Steroidobacter sp.]
MPTIFRNFRTLKFKVCSSIVDSSVFATDGHSNDAAVVKVPRGCDVRCSTTPPVVGARCARTGRKRLRAERDIRQKGGCSSARVSRRCAKAAPDAGKICLRQYAIVAVCGHGGRRVAVRAREACAAITLAGRHSRADGPAGFCRGCAAEPDLCRAWRAHDRCLARGSQALCFSGCRIIGQNVSLYCASEGLGSVFRDAIDYRRLARALRLSEQQFVTFAQTVGYPRT